MSDLCLRNSYQRLNPGNIEVTCVRIIKRSSMNIAHCSIFSWRLYQPGYDGVSLWSEMGLWFGCTGLNGAIFVHERTDWSISVQADRVFAMQGN